jgi:DMSO/TMAO reductase YedYZ molybdopterin-dependent catalytic subunit
MRLERATGWLAALLVGCIASGVALLLQNILRSAWQIRTLPERIMEWLLLFVPLDLFEKGLQQLGTDAKEVALAGTFVGMAVVLLAIGALVLRAGWPGWWLLGLGSAMWLFSMIVIMPITGAGLFGSGLLISPTLTSAGYLLVFLGYASVLVGGKLLLRQRALPGPRQQPLMADRRAFMAGAISALLAGGVTWFTGRQGGLVGSSLPLATAPTRRPATPVSPPVASQGTAAAAPTATPASGSAAASTSAAPAPSPTLPPLPDPPLPRRLARDDGGSLTAAGRPKGQLANPITSNSDFYIVTKNAVADPVVDAASWRLVIDGEVNRPVQVDYRTLSGLPSVEVTKTLECISNFTAGCSLTSFGCDLVSTAVWKGVRLADVLELAGGLKPSAVGLAFLATDEFSAGLPTDIVDDPECLIVYEMNGQPLPREHGFPMRLLVPGRYGMKNPKWLAGIRAMNQEYAGWYEQRNWNKDGIVKTMARIDLPIDGATLEPGEQRVAGVAYAGDRGVRQVDISPDDGVTWLPMGLLEPMPGKDAMVRWEGTFMLPPGAGISLTVRATDGTGTEQVDEFQLPQPDGASGRDQVTVNAA